MLEPCLRDYREALALEGVTAVHEPLFRTFTAIPVLKMTGERMQRHDAYRMVRRRVDASGIIDPEDLNPPKFGNHSFRATGITTYLDNGGTLERAQRMANHASTRTTQLYDRRDDAVDLDEVEKVRI